ncbi:SDR family oxidoreductase [Paenibacillus amylolyticus]|nr:SDR family oxidoreductase [Paenibacillus amylolyticus]WFR61267.1 SDR family oxidoreductase [Paenibacillus amylolyticus]
MNILVLGATGRVGSHLVANALRSNHHVTALVRNPEKVHISDNNFVLHQGNALIKEDIHQAMLGADLVVSALGTDGTTTLSQSTRLIVEVMAQEHIQRIITIGTAGILESRTDPDMFRFQSSESKRKSTRAAEEHLEMYNMLKASELKWTIVCPTYLYDGESLGTYRIERDYLPVGGTSISVKDTAEFAYQQFMSDDYVQSRVGIAY